MFSNRLYVLKFTKLQIIILHLDILMECLNYFSLWFPKSRLSSVVC